MDEYYRILESLPPALRDELVKAGIPMPENVITPDACAEELFKLLK